MICLLLQTDRWGLWFQLDPPISSIPTRAAPPTFRFKAAGPKMVWITPPSPSSPGRGAHVSTPALPQRYSIASLLGEGEQGRVYRVQDSLRDRELALKLVSASDAEFLRREFDTLRQIRHENLIQVFDWATLDSGEAFYTMELVEGEDWGRRMGTVQPAEEVRRILTGVLRGLAHLHCHGEVHGDLKPGNILLGQGGVVKVTDVGMGGDAGGGIAGTPGYTAPECWEGKAPGVRSDLYSVGVMAYEALTAKHPFGGRTIREVVAGQIEGWVPSPGVHRVKVPADLERVVMRAMEREVTLRQGSADEFMEGFGVEDRVGMILGGRFVGREGFLETVLSIVSSEDPRRASLIRIVGPPGSGKEAFLREIVHQLSSRGIGSSTWEEWEVRRGSNLKSPGPRGRLHVVLVGGAGARGQDRQEAGVRAARDAWASAVEAGLASDLVFLAASTAVRPAVHSCEFVLELEPLPVDRIADYLGGILGRATIPQPLISRIHAITGGNPESVTAAARSLVTRGLLARRDSTWQFNETTEIRTLDIPEVASPWRATWLRLELPDRDALLAIALAGPKVNDRALRALGIELRALKPLEARGYLNGRGGEWSLASEGMHTGFLGAASDSDLESVSRRLLELPGVLGLERRADLLLKRRDPSALDLAMEAAGIASARGEHYLAMRRFRECRELATALHKSSLASDCALKEAEALNLVGRFAETISLLELEPPEPTLSPERAAKHHHLLGIAKRGVGDIGAAAEHFERSQQLWESAGAHDDALSSLCELAEARWQFGTLDDRKSIVAVLRAELTGPHADSIQPDLRAALTYHLGAALLVLGELEEARRELESAERSECSSFWKMRVRIALGTVEHRSGNAARALVRFDEAWAECEKSGVDAFRPRIMTNRGATLYQQGRFRDAMAANTLGLNWARRVGNLTELMFAALGTAGCSVILGEYDAALRDSEEAMTIAEVYGDPISVEKAMELKSWAHYWLGNYKASEQIANAVIERFGNWASTETRPRLYWVLSRVRYGSEDLQGARKWLEEALPPLRHSGDPEDLPGVEIEVLRLEGQTGNEVERAALIRRIRGITDATTIPTVITLGAIAIGEILLNCPHGFEAEREFLLRALASADSSEIAEASWRINFYLGALSRIHGDDRNTRTRFAAALKALQRIADRLDSANRLRYLESPHVRPLLSSMSAPARVK